MNKLWFTSKTLLFNLAAIAAMAVQVGLLGNVVPLEYQATALAVANVALRFITTQGVTAPSGADVLDAADALKRALAATKKVVLRK